MTKEFSLDTRPWGRRDSLLVGWIVLVALTLRVIYLVGLAGTPFFDQLFINAANYDLWAREGYPPGEPYFQAPLYIFFLKVVYAFTSDDARFWVARLAQMFLGCGTAVLAYGGARLFGGPLAGSVAGFTCAASGSLIYFDGEILPTCLATFLLTLFLVLWVGAERSRPEKLLRWVLPGIVLGMAATCRPNFLLLAPVLGIVVLVRDLRARRGVVPILLLTAAVLLPVGIVAARNTMAGQGPVLLTANVGYNFLLGHNPDADGLDPFPPPEVDQFVQRLRREGATLVEQSAAAAAEGRRFFWNQPARALGLWWKKFWLFYHRSEIPNNRSIAYQVARSPVLRWPPAGWIGLGVLFPLALAGLTVVGRIPGVRVPYLAILVVSPLSVMAFLVCARFRAPTIPLLAILAAAAVWRLREGVSRRQLLAMGALASLGVFVAWPDWYGVRRTDFLPLSINRAKLFQQAGDRQVSLGDEVGAREWYGRAEATLRDAAQAFPERALPRARLGYLHRVQGRSEEARRHYVEALEKDPEFPSAHFGLALLAHGRQDYGTEKRHLLRAITSDPHQPDYHAQLGLVYYLEKEYGKGAESYENARALTSTAALDSRSSLEAWALLGHSQVAERGGDFATAEQHLRRAVSLRPREFTFPKELARFLARRGRHRAAADVLRACLSLELPPPVRQQLEALERQFRNQG